ncbi:MAG: alpha-L-fucosidase, partial [Phycisphaerales bacterium]|nr:alpha-L-fucosidase [Phycisphaerales bacterium]
MRARSHIAAAALLALGVLVAAASAQPAADPFAETPAQHDARMAWWRDARFGMFIHWGLYAIPAGRWGDSTDHAEWIRTTAQIPVDEYDALLERFNPVNFDAAAWARTAREAGMRYIVITAKHHDGFCLFDSAHTDFDVMSTPFGRDIIRELADAARAEGLQIGFYYSIMDWHHPDYLPRRGWEEADRPAGDADFERYEDYLHAQVTELLTNYGPIGVMWFDGEWESTWSEARGRDLYALCRRLQPDVIVNNRVGAGREGMAGLTRQGAFAGDFGTPEQEVPATGIPGVDWESCMTMNDHWGYNAFDTRWKSPTTLIRTLVDIASKGGNFLLNVGPRADGTFPPEAVDRLREMGRWMGQNGSGISETQAGPFGTLPWGRTTLSQFGDDRYTLLFLHVFNRPDDGRLVLPGVATDPEFGRLFSANGPIESAELDYRREGANGVISGLSQLPLNSHCSVILVAFPRGIDVYAAPTVSAPTSEFTDTLTITLAHDRGTPESPLALRY